MKESKKKSEPVSRVLYTGNPVPLPSLCIGRCHPMSSDLPAVLFRFERNRTGHSPLFSLAHDEVCHAMPISGHAVGSYPTFSPLPSLAVYFLWHSLYTPDLGLLTGSRCVPDVIRHRALMSPDFPRRFLTIAPRQHGSLHIQKPISGRKVTGSCD